MSPIPWYRWDFWGRWERRRYDRTASVVCFFLAVLLILIVLWFILLSWIGQSFLFLIISLILIPTIFIIGCITLSLLRADRRRRAALRAQAYLKDQYPARYPFSGRRLDRESEEEQIVILQSRIAELEKQLAIARQQRTPTVSEAPEVVEIVEIRDRDKATEPKVDALEKEQRLLREELKAEKAAINLLLFALEEALVTGAISEKEYLLKEKKYKKELKSLDKKLKSLGKKK